MSDILGFDGEYRYLSNFYSSPFWAFGCYWHTNEHFYQAMKAKDPADHERVAEARTPGEAKKLGRKLRMRHDWEFVKDQVMWVGLNAKFTQHRDLAVRLAHTGDSYLEETNHWGDTYWGVCDGVGKNRLGLQLMALRHTILLTNPAIYDWVVT